MTAAAAAEYKSNIGPDITLSDAVDDEHIDEGPAEDEKAARQALNVRMAEWFGIA